MTSIILILLTAYISYTSGFYIAVHRRKSYYQKLFEVWSDLAMKVLYIKTDKQLKELKDKVGEEIRKASKKLN